MEKKELKETFTKVLEYASSPVEGTLSRKQRKGVKLQINEGRIYDGAVLFIGDQFIRVTESIGGEHINTYLDWDNIASMRTFSKTAEE